MAESDSSVLSDIARIERDADAILDQANAEAARARAAGEEQVRELIAETDRAIKATREQLTAEHQAQTKQALEQIEAEFAESEAAVKSVREQRSDELSGWAAEQIAARLRPEGADGD